MSEFWKVVDTHRVMWLINQSIKTHFYSAICRKRISASKQARKTMICVAARLRTMSFINWMCQRGLLTRLVSCCTAVFMVRHLGPSPTISPRPPTSLHGFVCVLQTVASSLYLAVFSTHMAVGRFRSPVRRSGTRCMTSSEIRRVDGYCFKQFLKTILFSLFLMWPAHYRIFLMLCAI